MVIEMEDEAPPKEKRQKKKQVNRKPLCTFVNYLGNINEDGKESKTDEEAEEKEDEQMDMDVEVSSFGGMSTEMKKLSLDNSLDDSSTTSIETVNTSNKSMDAMVRDDRFNFDTARPAVDRWMDPPPPLPKDPDDLAEGLYITSRCESDSESEEDTDKPKEIIFRKKRTRCPRIHRWQNRQTNVRALPIRGNIHALPKTHVRPYKGKK